MSTVIEPRWEAKRTKETRAVETFLGQSFEQVQSYRYNSASIRIRVIDARFKGLDRADRDAMVEPYLDQLPQETQRDILMLVTLSPDDLERTPATFKEFTINVEFDDPSPSMI